MHYLFIIFAVFALAFVALGALSVWSVLLYWTLKLTLMLLCLLPIPFIVHALWKRFNYGRSI